MSTRRAIHGVFDLATYFNLGKWLSFQRLLQLRRASVLRDEIQADALRFEIQAEGHRLTRLAARLAIVEEKARQRRLREMAIEESEEQSWKRRRREMAISLSR